MSGKIFSLSKSKVMCGLQCEKSLYLLFYAPKLADSVSAYQQMIFDQGYEVGTEAQKRFLSGVLIDAPYTAPDRAIADTTKAMSEGALVIFEAAFKHDGVFVQVDVLHRASTSSPWQIVEVKSSTELKPQYIQDLAIQMWVLQSCGLNVESTHVWHINNKCVFPKLEDLFTSIDVTRSVVDTIPQIIAAVANFKTLLAKSKAPEQDIGPHCDDPYECAFKDSCWSTKKIPPISIFDIPGFQSKKKWNLYRGGVLDLADIGNEKLNEVQKRMVNATINGKRFVDPVGIGNELDHWEYPLYYLDFETIGWAVPRCHGTRPYQQIPFQFSCHSQLSPSGALFHSEYLHDSDSDPRGKLAAALLAACGTSGSIVSYNKGFEGRCIRELAEHFPKYSGQLLALIERLVDPHPVIKQTVYDPKFKGSFSIKDVAPALLGNRYSYEGLAVADGTSAQVAYLEMISLSCSPFRKEQLRDAMLTYCRKDTLAMVSLVQWLSSQLVPVAVGE